MVESVEFIHESGDRVNHHSQGLSHNISKTHEIFGCAIVRFVVRQKADLWKFWWLQEMAIDFRRLIL